MYLATSFLYISMYKEPETKHFRTHFENPNSQDRSWSSSVVRILFESCFGNLTTTMTLLMVQVQLRDRALEVEASRVKVLVGDWDWLVVRELWYGRVGNGEIVEDDTVIESLKSDLESVLEIANLLRTMMATKLVEILSSRQAVRFSTTVTQFQLKIRLERDTEKQRELSGGGGGGSPIGW